MKVSKELRETRKEMRHTRHMRHLKERLDNLPDKYKMWNGIKIDGDIWIDKVMSFGVEVKNKRHEKIHD